MSKAIKNYETGDKMKKIVLASLLLVGSVFANETSKTSTVYDKEYETTKGMMADMKQFPAQYSVVNDYFQAKTCMEDFTEKVTIEQIREFLQSAPYATMATLKILSEDDSSKNTKMAYMSLLGAYEYLSCGNTDSFDKFSEGFNTNSARNSLSANKAVEAKMKLIN